MTEGSGMQAMVDRPGSVLRPLTPMKRPRSLQSGSSAESDDNSSANGDAQALRQQLEHAQVPTMHQTPLLTFALTGSCILAVSVSGLLRLLEAEQAQ